MTTDTSYSYYLLLGKDRNGAVTYEIPWAYTGTAVPLTATTESHITVPANVDTAFFSFGTGTDVWVDGKATLAGIPSGATTADLNPVARRVYEGQTLSFYCGTASIAKVSFYNLQNRINLS